MAKWRVRISHCTKKRDILISIDTLPVCNARHLRDATVEINQLLYALQAPVNSGSYKQTYTGRKQYGRIRAARCIHTMRRDQVGRLGVESRADNARNRHHQVSHLSIYARGNHNIEHSTHAREKLSTTVGVANSESTFSYEDHSSTRAPRSNILSIMQDAFSFTLRPSCILPQAER